MVELSLYFPLHLSKVGNHTVGIQFCCLTVEGDNPIVAVQPRALALVVEYQTVTSRDFQLLF